VLLLPPPNEEDYVSGVSVRLFVCSLEDIIPIQIKEFELTFISQVAALVLTEVRATSAHLDTYSCLYFCDYSLSLERI